MSYFYCSCVTEILYTGVQVDTQPKMHDVGVQCILPHLHSNVKDAGVQCTLLCPVTTSSPLKCHPVDIPQSESEISDIEGDKHGLDTSGYTLSQEDSSS